MTALVYFYKSLIGITAALASASFGFSQTIAARSNFRNHSTSEVSVIYVVIYHFISAL